MKLKLDISQLTGPQKEVLVGIFQKTINAEFIRDEEVKVVLHDLAYGDPFSFTGKKEDFPPSEQLLQLFNMVVEGKYPKVAGAVAALNATARAFLQDMIPEMPKLGRLFAKSPVFG